MSMSIWTAVVTLEAVSPLLVGTGKGDDVRDAVCVADANGLATIPGSAIAGVLRSLWEDSLEGDLTRAVFGCKDGESKAFKDGAPSRLTVGWAAIHDANNIPASPLPGEAPDDDVIRFIRTGLQRDHVRINGNGVVDAHGKFDVSPVPAGARFSFELMLRNPSEAEIQKLLATLCSPAFRIGAQTRRGLGTVKVVTIRAKVFTLTKAADHALWVRYAQAANLEHRAKLLPDVPSKPSQASGKGWTLTLNAPLGWRVGGGVADDTEKVHRKGGATEPVQLAPYREERIEWHGDRAKVSKPTAILPATAIKGPLRHRTLFHLRRHRPAEADADITALFGIATTTTESGKTEGGPGCVYIDDVWVTEPTSHLQHHVALDRFSGAPLAGALFSEAVLTNKKFPVHVRVDRKLTEHQRVALHAALTDLVKGRLALGAAGSRGHGYFTGDITEGT